MIVPNQEVEIHWRANNREYYENKGYKFTSYSDVISVKTDDLHPMCNQKVDVVCDICGEVKSISFYAYVRNINSNGKYICHPCSRFVAWQNSLKARQEKYYSQLQEKCKEYGYDLISKPEDIKRNNTKIKYVCPKHGEQSMRVHNLLNGRKCPECNHEQHSLDYRLTQEEVVRRVEDCGGIILNPEDYINSFTDNLKFVCRNCGEIFTSQLKHYLQHGGKLCPDCSKTISVGESKIKEFLERNNISYESEKWFHDLKDVKPLRFDFYLKDMNTMIEFDGVQHFVNKGYFRHSVEQINAHDEMKNEYCKKKGITMIRIPYTKINSIEKILTEKLLT